jgi:hypothetical protein
MVLSGTAPSSHLDFDLYPPAHVSFCAMQWQHWVCYPTRVLREGLIFTKRSNRRLVSGMLSQVLSLLGFLDANPVG